MNKAKSFRGRLKDTKTGDARWVDLSPLALQALDAMVPSTKKAGADIFQTPSEVERVYHKWLHDADGSFARKRLDEAFG